MTIQLNFSESCVAWDDENLFGRLCYRAGKRLGFEFGLDHFLDIVRVFPLLGPWRPMRLSQEVLPPPPSHPTPLTPLPPVHPRTKRFTAGP